MESTDAGCARLFISETSDAAVYWHTMNPEIDAGITDKKRRQPVRSLRVQQPVQPALGYGGEPDGRGGERIAGERDRLAVEVAPRQDLTGRGEHDGIVGDRRQLDLEGDAGVADDVPERAVDLRSTADRVGVLNDVVALTVRGEQVAPRQQAYQVPGRGHLARVRAEPDDARIERTVGSEDGLDRERGRDVGELGESDRPRGRQHADGRHALSAVDQGEALLRFEHQGLETETTEGLDRRESLAGQPDVTLSDDGKGEMREGCEIARGAERALLRHDGQQIALEHLHETKHHLAPHARVPERQHVRPERQHRPDLLGGELVADGDRVGAQQPVLEGRGMLRGEPHVGQAAEAGRHAVHDRSCLQSRDDDLTGGVDSPEDLVAHDRRSAFGDPDHPVDLEGDAELDGRRVGHGPSMASGCSPSPAPRPQRNGAKPDRYPRGCQRNSPGARSPTPAPSSTPGSRYRALMNEVPGVSFGISHEGEAAVLGSWGYADLATLRPAEPDTGYRVASITKTVTATLVMQLVEAGRLRLDEPVTSYLGWLEAPLRRSGVTVRHLLTHSSGMIRDGVVWVGRQRVSRQ